MNRTCYGILLISAFVLQACGGGGASGASGVASAAVPTASASASPTSSATATPDNLAALPLDDYHYTSSGPEEGYVYSCQSSFMGQGPSTVGPWVNVAANTWDLETKSEVEGSVSWAAASFSNTTSGSDRIITTNDLPQSPSTSGTFPISPSDPAYQYDMNPNSIFAQNLTFDLPLNPTEAAEPSCVNMGPIGVMLTGVVLYNALDALGRDAAAHEVLDSCWGHPDQSGTYHYHMLSPCMSDPGTGHSNLLGYALDGFGIYGPRGEDGEALTSADLDACHGHTHAITWNGKTVVMYHYHLTYDYPYSVGCYRGTPIQSVP